MDFAVFADNLSTTVDKSRLPLAEPQVRPIMKAFREDADQQRTAWLQACECVESGVPATEVVKTVVAEMRGMVAPKADGGEIVHGTQRSDGHRIYAIVGQIESVLRARPDLVDIQPLFDQLKLELEQLLPKAV